MSIICTVYLPEGIVMSADSRMTGSVKNDEHNTLSYTISDNAQKVFYLEKAKVGISCCGSMFIEGKTIADYLRIFEIEDIKKNDSVLEVARACLKTCGMHNTQHMV